MTRYVLRDGELVEKKYARPRWVTGVITDGMDALVSQADGKIYDSKSAYRRSLKENGCIEVGNDPAASRRQEMQEVGGIERDIADAYHQLRAR